MNKHVSGFIGAALMLALLTVMGGVPGWALSGTAAAGGDVGAAVNVPVENPTAEGGNVPAVTNAVASNAPASSIPVNTPRQTLSETESGAVIDLAASGGVDAKSDSTNNSTKISIALDAVPIPDVVSMFSRISGANISIAGNFTNLFVTASFKDVEWRDALRHSLASVDLTMLEDPASGIIMVVSRDQSDSKKQLIEGNKPLVTRTIKPKYLNAVDLVEQVKLMKVLSPRGTITTSQSKLQDVANMKATGVSGATPSQNPSIMTEIIISDIKEYMEKIDALIKELDKCEPQVFIDARIIDVSNTDDKKVGFDWEMLDRFGVTAGLRDLQWNYADNRSVANSKANTDTLLDQRTRTDKVDNRSDLYGMPYEETTTTYEESPPGSGNWIANTITTPTRAVNDNITLGRTRQSTLGDTVTRNRTEGKTASAIMSVSDASLYFSALQKSGNAEMLSHPVLIVGNKVEAKIHVGEQTYKISLQKNIVNAGNASPEASYSEKADPIDLGLKLWVIPEVDQVRKSIRLSVEPEMTVWVRDITTAQGSIYPVTSTRRLTTRVNVPSGHTVVIGGLIENKKSKQEKRVPVLGDIPLLGMLFRHTQDVVEKHNLIIMLSPTILDDRNPITGFESLGQQTIDKFEKTPVVTKGPSSKKKKGDAAGTNGVVGAGTASTNATASAGTSVAPVAGVELSGATNAVKAVKP